MARNNPVFQVLIPSGNQAVLAAGSPVTALAIGQMGIFNADTNLSIDGSTAILANNFYVAIGTDPGGTGAATNIIKSAGQYIQRANVTNLTARCWSAPRVGIFDITDFTVSCDTDYGIKFLIANQAAYATHGYNLPSKTFFARSSCCDACETCGTGDINDLVNKLVTNMNLDEDHLFTASFISASSTLTATVNATASGDYVFTLNGTTVTVAVTSGDTPTVEAGKIVTAINALAGSPYFAKNASGVVTIYQSSPTAAGITYAVVANPTGSTFTFAATAHTVVTPANYAAFIAANPGAGLGIRITTVAEPLRATMNGNLNPAYDGPRGTVITPALVEGFGCSGVITTVQTMRYEQGSGYDMAENEYRAAGYNGAGNYRQSELTGFIYGFNSQTTASAKLVTIALTYDHFSVAGWGEHLNNMELMIGVPCADTTTLTALATFFDAMFAGKLEAILPYTSTCDCTGADGEISAINNAAIDGIAIA